MNNNVTDSSSPTFLPADADKMSAVQLADTHVPQPGVPERFSRSTMIIGSRGSGKTFLLRHRKQVAHAGAVFISLKKTLNPVVKDTGLGGKAVDYPPALADQVRGKSAAILAATTMEHCARECDDSMDMSLSLLDRLLPSQLRSSEAADGDSIRALRHDISRHPVSEWSGLQATALFVEALEEIGAGYPNPLALFFDRAEDVPFPAISLLLALLDQSFPFLTVIAARPYVSRLLATDAQPTSVAGDHYDLLHIGMSPYTDEWQSFMFEAVERFLAANEIACPPDLSLDWVTRLSRDCSRDAMSTAQLAISTADDPANRLAQLADKRAQRLARARAALFPSAPNFESFVGAVNRKCGDVLTNGPQVSVLVSFEDEQSQISLLGPLEDKRSVLLDAIQADALFYPPDTGWRPYELPTTMELAPLLAWNGENTTWIE